MWGCIYLRHFLLEYLVHWGMCVLLWMMNIKIDRPQSLQPRVLVSLAPRLQTKTSGCSGSTCTLVATSCSTAATSFVQVQQRQGPRISWGTGILSNPSREIGVFLEHFRASAREKTLFLRIFSSKIAFWETPIAKSALLPSSSSSSKIMSILEKT